MPRRTDWSERLRARVSEEPGWRVEEDAKGRAAAYAPDGKTIVRLMDTDADFRWRQNTLAELRRNGLDLYAEFKSSSTKPKAQRRKKETVAPKQRAAAPARMPLPDELPASVEDWSLTDHAREQAEARKIDVMEVYAAATVPTLTRPADNESGRMIHTRGDLAVVVDPRDRAVITVLPPVDRIEAERKAARKAVKKAVPAPVKAAAKPEPVVTPEGGWADPNEVRTFVAGLTDAFLQCREMGHNWRPWQAYWDEDERCFHRALRCSRCKTQRWQRLSQTGQVLGGSYIHAEGYLHKGRGRLTGEARDTLRLESVVRVMKGTMSGVDKQRGVGLSG